MGAQNWLHADVAMVLVAPETTAYADDDQMSTDASAEAAIFVRELTVKPVIHMVDKQRYGQTFRSPGQLPGKKFAEVEFTVPFPEMVPTTFATPAGLDYLFAASSHPGTDATASSAPVGVDSRDYVQSTFNSTNGQQSCTISCWVFKDGDADGSEVWEVNGAVFNVEPSFVADEEATLKFTGMGLYNKPASSSFTNSPDWIAPDDGLVMQNAYMSLGATLITAPIKELTLNPNFEVKERTAINRVSSTITALQNGVAGFMLSRMGNVTGNIKIEAGLESADGYWADVEGATLQELLCYFETPKGIYGLLQIPKLQLGSPDVERDGTLIYSFPFVAQDNSDAGDNIWGLRLSVADHSGDGTGWDSSATIF